ncbi:DUF4012 domain-containing protein [Candidatus Gracilibacteria bacterium]|nr:DUF4012 domain-containing protein [Candidatus Gracilibacteria bacterium]
MDKLNDLETNLDENIDLSDSIKRDIKPSKLGNRVIYDIFNFKKPDINLKLDKKIRINKYKTKNFDSFSKQEKNTDIDLVKQNKDFSFYFDSAINPFKKRYLIYKINKPKKVFRFKKYSLFIIFILFFFLTSKILIENLVTSGYQNILNLKQDFGNNSKVLSDIKQAKVSFFFADILVKPFTFLPNDNVRNVIYIIDGGKDLSNLASKTYDLYIKTNLFIDSKGGPQNIYLTNLLVNIRDNYEEIYYLLYKSLLSYSKVGDLGNSYLNEKLSFTKERLKTGLLLLETINKNYDTMLNILGAKEEKKYLLIFQNNDEIRATGGFMGSTALITISNGNIKNIENSDIYALEWLINKVYTDKQKAPEGLDKITGTFGLRDANYYPFFRDSSNSIKYFLDKIDYKIDGIIYINQNVILDLLDSVKGVDSKILGKKITSENFSLVISTLVEAKVFKVGTLGTPKQILFDFAGEFKEKLLEKKDYYSYLKVIVDHVKNRDLVFYSFDSDENSLLWKLGVNGEINLNSTLDFNYPVYISIGGNKTDRYIEYRYDKSVSKISGTCDFETKLDIYKSHHFSKFEDEKVNMLLDSYGVVNKTDILNIQGRGINKSFTRILLPKNALVNISSGQKVYEMENYKVVELYINTEKLETSLNTISYVLKNPNCTPYTYKFFKQPGIKKYNINFDMFGKKDKYNSIKSDFIYKKDIILE